MEQIISQELRRNRIAAFQTHTQVFIPVNTSICSLMYSVVPDMRLQCMFGKEEKLGNIKVTSKFMLSLKNAAVNVKHFGVLLNFISSTTVIVITFKSSKQQL